MAERTIGRADRANLERRNGAFVPGVALMLRRRSPARAALCRGTAEEILRLEAQRAILDREIATLKRHMRSMVS